MSFGEELRRERELREISLREVSEATKINLRYLEAMERNDFAYLPGGLFNRGFVRAYCQYIGVDSEAMVNAYLLEVRTQDDSGSARDRGLLRGPASRGGKKTEGGTPVSPRRRRVALVLAALVLAVAAALAALWWLGWLGTPDRTGAHGEAGMRDDRRVSRGQR